MRKRTREQWLEELGAAGVPCSPVHNLAEMCSHPHTQASGMIMQYTQPARGPLQGVAQPLRFNGQRQRLRKAPPQLGEHTRGDPGGSGLYRRGNRGFDCGGSGGGLARNSHQSSTACSHSPTAPPSDRWDPQSPTSRHPDHGRSPPAAGRIHPDPSSRHHSPARCSPRRAAPAQPQCH